MKYAAFKYVLVAAVMALAQAVPTWYNGTDGRQYLVDTQYEVNFKLFNKIYC